VDVQTGPPAGPSERRRGPRHRAAKRPRFWARRLVVGLGVLALLIGLLGLGAFVYLHYRYNQIAKLSVGGLQADANGPMTILLVGSNSRAVLNGQQANAFGTPQEVGGARSDVTMLLHVDPSKHSVSVLSIPRDLLAPAPSSKGSGKIDASLNNGATNLVAAIEQDLGIPINHYVELNFDSFQNVVNDLGGIDMYFPVPVKDAYSALNIPSAGCRHLDGFQALAVVRARHLYYLQNGSWHYDGLGDLSRIKRDHEFLRVLFSAVAQKGLSNPLTANSVLGSLAPQLKVDNQFSLGLMVSLARQFHSMNANTVPTETLPVIIDQNDYVYNGTDLGQVVLPAQPVDQQVIDQFLGVPTTSSVSPSSISLSVLNGSGAYNQATQISDQLRPHGYNVVNVGDAPITGHPAETVIHYAPGQLAAAERLASDLSGSFVYAQGGTPPGVDLQLVTGSTLSVAPVAPAAGAPGASSAPAPAASPSDATPAQETLPSYDPTACSPAEEAAAH
jgi:LCP family protein required for cell wall assembly